MNILKEFLEYKLFSIHNYNLYMYEVVAIIAIFVIAFVVDKIIKKLLYKSTKIDGGTKYALHQIFYYLIIIATIFISMRTLGIDISPLLMGSSVILVGIGLGLQGLFLDFISGIIILMERSVRVNDVLDIDGVMGKVIHINMRTTLLQTTDKRIIIFPNSVLTKNKLINYSSHYELNSFNIDVGVAYDTDLDLAQKLLIEAANENPKISKVKTPFTRLDSFGDSALNLKLYFLCDDPFDISQIKSEIRINILNKFREHNIIIPYPTTTIDYPNIKN